MVEGASLSGDAPHGLRSARESGPASRELERMIEGVPVGRFGLAARSASGTYLPAPLTLDRDQVSKKRSKSPKARSQDLLRSGVPPLRFAEICRRVIYP